MCLLLVQVHPASQKGGVLFAITDARQKVVELGLALSPVSNGIQDILLYYTDREEASHSHKAAAFSVPDMTGQWTRFTVSITHHNTSYSWYRAFLQQLNTLHDFFCKCLNDHIPGWKWTFISIQFVCWVVLTSLRATNEQFSPGNIHKWRIRGSNNAALPVRWQLNTARCDFTWTAANQRELPSTGGKKNSLSPTTPASLSPTREAQGSTSLW